MARKPWKCMSMRDVGLCAECVQAKVREEDLRFECADGNKPSDGERRDFECVEQA